MKTLADRFRRWYDHERDSNAKCIAMLESVPAERRADPSFQRAVDKMAHLATARLRWLYRLGVAKELPPIFPKGTTLSELRTMIAAAEAAWIDYLAPLDDAKLASEFEYTSAENKRYRWTIEGLLTQVNGHAWYHRGQIAMLVADLGGKAVDTDYIFFCKLEPIEVK
jgi:uncharacterized damage-inducible protein DinB